MDLVKLVTVSLRKDEIDAINAMLQENPKFESRHSIIKLAIRRFLFPHQLKDIPLNGHSATITPPIYIHDKIACSGGIVITKTEYDLEQDRKAEMDQKKAKARAAADKWINEQINSDEEKARMRVQAEKLINAKVK